MKGRVVHEVSEGLKRIVSASLFSLVFLAIATDLAAAQSASQLRGLPYLTLRDRIDDADGYFGSQRSDLKAGYCIVGQTNLDFLSKAAEIAPFRIPEEILKLERIEEKPVNSLLNELEGDGRDAPLLYIHGYYINFDKGCRRATAFTKNAGLEDRLLWFSWPSDGSLLNYARDEVNIYWSFPDVADTIAGLHDRFGSGKVDLVGHSLGGRGLVLALYEIAASRPHMRFGEVVLLAPDMDFGVFRKLLPRIRPLARSITIYTSDSDSALEVSARLHGYRRLGESGNKVASLEDVEVIDTSRMANSSPTGHLYHLYSKEVGADLSQLVNEGETANKRRGLQKIGRNLWRLVSE